MKKPSPNSSEFSYRAMDARLNEMKSTINHLNDSIQPFRKEIFVVQANGHTISKIMKTYAEFISIKFSFDYIKDTLNLA